MIHQRVRCHLGLLRLGRHVYQNQQQQLFHHHHDKVTTIWTRPSTCSLSYAGYLRSSNSTPPRTLAKRYRVAVSTRHDGHQRRMFSSGVNERRAGNVKLVCYGIIGVCSLIMGSWWLAMADKNYKTLTRLHQNTMLSLQNVQDGRWWVVITSAVTHIGTGHFIFNMLAVNAFCSVLSWVPRVGGFQVLWTCLGSSIASSMAFLSYDARRMRNSPDDRRPGVACGLSGVNMGLAAVAACLVPRAPMALMFIPIPIPLYQAVAGFVALDLFFIGSNDSIGHSAHLGGFAYGILHYLLFLRRFRIPGSLFQARSSHIR